jgi:hypothetical protein
MAGPDLDELFRAWRSVPLPPSLPPGFDEGAGSGVLTAALRRVAERRRRTARLRKVVTAFALAATVTGVGVGAWFELGSDSRLARASSVTVQCRDGQVSFSDDAGRMLAAASALTEGYGVRTELGSATLGFPSGASAKISSRSALKLTGAHGEEALFLASGAIDVEVPKLDAAHGFSVATPDALVTVHGTLFRVSVEPTTDGSRTHVRVSRGIVSVRKGEREVFVHAGQEWPELDEVAPAQGPTSELTAPAPPQQPGVIRSKPHALDSRELADQNQRFARAMTAKKSGDGATALRELGAILRRYPRSPLTQEVRVERLGLLRELGQKELAAREAERYLIDFPHGYATAEARTMLAEQ